MRLVHYHVDAGGNLKVLMFQHKRNQQLTLLGGRLEVKDLDYAISFYQALWDETMSREAREEVGMDDLDFYMADFSGWLQQLGLVMWKHPTTGQVCADFITGFKCDNEFEVTLPADSELERGVWIDYTDMDATPYVNVRQTMQLLHDITTGEAKPGDVYYDPAQFGEFEYDDAFAKIYELLGYAPES